MPANVYFTITELADQYGVSLRTLRFYEERGLLEPLRVGSSRYYTGRDRIRLELIIKGKRLGFSLNEIYRLISTAKTPSEPERIETIMSKEEILGQLKALENKRNAVSIALSDLESALTLHRQGQKQD